jgi:intracellular septation protein A
VQSLLDAHEGIGWFLIGSNAFVGVWASAAQWIERLRHVALWWCIGAAQLSTFAAAIVGVILVNRYDAQLDQFHALYGFSAIVAVGILYSYRSSPFVKDKQYILYGLGSLFIMGLGIRELYLKA